MIDQPQQQFYSVLTLDLGIARSNQLIEMMGGFIYCLNSSSPTMSISIKLDNSANDSIPLTRQYGIIGYFKKFFITNTAQSGITVNLLISSSYDSLRVFEQVAATSVDVNQPLVRYGDTPTVYNITCTTAGTEYSQALTPGGKKFLIRPRTGSLKVCFTSGQSGTTYISIPAGGVYYEDMIYTNVTLYFQGDTNGQIAEIVKWT